MDPGTVIAALGAIGAWLALLRQEQHELQRNEAAAVRALYNAVNETRLYVRRLGEAGYRSPNRDFEREDHLSRLWMEAYFALRKISPNLAHKCMVKSGYWQEPERWSEAQVRVAGIKLDSICEEARSLANDRALGFEPIERK